MLTGSAVMVAATVSGPVTGGGFGPVTGGGFGPVTGGGFEPVTGGVESVFV